MRLIILPIHPPSSTGVLCFHGIAWSSLLWNRQTERFLKGTQLGHTQHSKNWQLLITQKCEDSGSVGGIHCQGSRAHGDGLVPQNARIAKSGRWPCCCWKTCALSRSRSIPWCRGSSHHSGYPLGSIHGRSSQGDQLGQLGAIQPAVDERSGSTMGTAG